MRDSPEVYEHGSGASETAAGRAEASVERPPRRWPWLLLFIVIAAAAGWWFYGRQAPSQAPTAERRGPPTPEVTVADVARKEATISIAAVGTVQPIKSVQILPLVEGPITKVAFDDGQMVKAGDVLFEIDPRPYRAALAQARGQMQADDANLESAKQDFGRTTQLAKSGYAARQTLDQQRQRVAQLEATRTTNDGRIAQAAINLERTKIRAPISGRLSAALQTEGNIVRPGQTQPLTTIVQIAPIDVQFTVPQDELQAIRARSADGPLDVRALLPDTGKEIATGKLVFIDNRVDATTATVAMKARFENGAGALWPGQFVNVALVVERRRDAVVVDSRAVQTGPKGRYVYVVRDGKAEMQPIQLVELQQEQGIVSEGLQGGEKVVIDGQLRIIPGGEVRIRGQQQKPAAGAAPQAAAGK